MTSSLDRARRVLAGYPLVDGHNDLPWAMRYLAGYDLEKMDPGKALEKTHTDLPRLRAGGVGAQFWSVYVPSSLPGDTAVTATLEQIDFVHKLVAWLPEDLQLALTADDVIQAFGSGRIASLLGAEGGQSIACSMGALRSLYALGVRYMTLTHNDNTPWADSATDEPGVGGLNGFGREVVHEMNRLGMLVDLSHVAASTMNDALDVSEAPVIFSHSSCRALTDHPRNVPDYVLRLLSDNGGVCMVTFVPPFVSETCRLWESERRAFIDSKALDPEDPELRTLRRAAAEEFAASNPRPNAAISDVVAHIEHAREVAGIAHVGLGGDYDGTDQLPDGLEDVSCYPALIAALLERGWSEQDCTALTGGNLLRALREAESVASKLQKERSPSVARLEDFPSNPLDEI
ncbi:MAG TPA: dipeptidase [Acidimicrobiales bacterium]|nr:dipeptidase [Acidimicrobiales bacterium]